MKVILNDHIEHLGERGAVVDVKPGYARNYLLPKGLAFTDTPGNRRVFEEQQDRWQEMDLKRRSAAEQVRDSLTNVELRFDRRAGEKNVLFGSVTAADIANGLSEKGFEIDKKRVRLDEVIKELGSYQVEVQIHRDIRVAIPVYVVRPGEPLEVPEADDAQTAEDSEADAVTES